ncbi:caspase family protein [Methyloligella sp. GL2]|nr:caspase family protein [Methyloligella sp. GL2]
MQAAALYGLAAGIDNYSSGPLSGAEADAADIAAALEAAGANEVVLLKGEDATRAAVLDAWTDLLSKAERGDTVIFSFAGKGSAGTDGPAYLLAGDTALSRQDILTRAKQADARGVHTLFLGDASFGGDLNRPVSALDVQLRQAASESVADGTGEAPIDERGFSYGSFVYGAAPGGAVPEVAIGSSRRGALSWAFARALQGAADANRDGAIDDHELRRYLGLAVGALTEGQQTPHIVPNRLTPVTLAPVSRDGNVAADDDGPLRLAVIGEVPPALESESGIEVVSDPGEAELIWNRAEKRLDHYLGGQVAEGVDRRRLAPALAKWKALKRLRLRAALMPAPIDLVSGDRLYGDGDFVQIEVLPGRYPYLTIFDLSPEGWVVPILPADASGADKQWKEHIHQMFRQSSPPNGALHRVVIFSKSPMTGLQVALKRMEGKGATGLSEALAKAFADESAVQVGIFPIYSGQASGQASGTEPSALAP